MRTAILLFCLTVLSVCTLSPLYAQESKDIKPENPTETKIETSPAIPAASTEYLIGIGDSLDISIERRPELQWRGQVGSDGNINGLAYLNKSVRVLCLTEQKAAEEIKTAYAELIKNPAITVRVIERSTQPVILLGAVRTPQRFQMQRDARLIELLFIAGGVTDRSSGDIQIFTPNPTTCNESIPTGEAGNTQTANPIRVIKILDLMAGTKDTNPVIRPGDIVTVMAAEPVYVTGGVASPQGINFREQLTLSRAIATVGGLTSNARGSEIHIYRRTQNIKEQSIIKADYNAIRTQKQPDIPLMAYDIIEVPQSSASDGSGRRTWQSAAQDIIIDEKKSGALPLRVLN
jgi:polysaccharide export outer membrane protein